MNLEISKDLSLKNKAELINHLRELFSSQSLAVLATQDRGEPYGNLVAFAVTEDLKYLLFATTRATRKYNNLTKNPRIAMVIDNRSNREEDFQRAMAATATGVVEEIGAPDRDHFVKLYLAKHPYLVEFVTSPTCALLKVNVETYYVVSQFQNVMELHLNDFK